MVNEIKSRVKAEGKSPAIVASPLHDIDAYALQFGWAAFWALDDQERARVVATMQIEREIEFVGSYWSSHGEFSAKAAQEVAEEVESGAGDDPFTDWK